MWRTQTTIKRFIYNVRQWMKWTSVTVTNSNMYRHQTKITKIWHSCSSKIPNINTVNINQHYTAFMPRKKNSSSTVLWKMNTTVCKRCKVPFQTSGKIKLDRNFIRYLKTAKQFKMQAYKNFSTNIQQTKNDRRKWLNIQPAKWT